MRMFLFAAALAVVAPGCAAPAAATATAAMMVCNGLAACVSGGHCP
jgi:hypothetical protein